ncbi:MAG: YbhB/YbcL family Raf kinase inhibitor-like protein [Armatimonadota bacterium]
MIYRWHLGGGVLLALLIVCAGCQRAGQPASLAPGQAQASASTQRKEARMVWTLTSSAFKEGEPIPRKYTCDGDSVSPPLSWTTPPAKTLELALICDDPDAPRGTFTHWVLYGLPARTTSLPESVPKTETLATLGGAKQGKNSADRVGYTGPCPPSGLHHYHFMLFALDAKTGLKPGATEKELRSAMNGHIIGQAELVGVYSR